MMRFWLLLLLLFSHLLVHLDEFFTNITYSK
jgi:hypothetical protein